MTSDSDNEFDLLREENINNLEKLYVNMDNNKKCLLFIIRLSLSVILIIINSPIVITDIIYAFSKQECLHLSVGNFKINMSLYLLVSGFASLLNIICCLIAIWLYNFQDERQNKIFNNNIIKILSLLFSIGQLSWNITGGYIFLELLNNHFLCSNFIVTYLFASIIIKLCFNFLSLLHVYRKFTIYNMREID
jgi:hypothetical protein